MNFFYLIKENLVEIMKLNLFVLVFKWKKKRRDLIFEDLD